MPHRVLQRQLRKLGLDPALMPADETAWLGYWQFDDEIRAVITDIMMPVMDGSALIRALHRLKPDVKVIAASGLSTHETLAETTGVAVQAFLSKPYETVHLLSTLNRILNAADTLGVPADL